MTKPVLLPSGSWRIQITVNGKRIGKTFGSKSECKVWAAGQISRSVEDAEIGIKNISLWQLAQEWISRYSESRAQGKRDTARLTNILQDTDFGRVQLRALDHVRIATWRDERLKSVGPATVRRDWNILSSMCSTAIIDMGYMKENPFKVARRPAPPPARDRLLTDEEVERLAFSMGDSRIKPAFLFAIETAMSAGEICALTWDQISGQVLTLPPFKTRPKRHVPLSKRAVELLGPPSEGLVFSLTTASADALWRKYRDKAGLEDVHFHDLRHLAITRLAKKLNVLELARMVGHRDIRQLMTYYNETAENLAAKLD